MNIASRLVSLAKPNEIIVSDVTFQKVRDRIEAVPLPPVMVKGKAEEQKIFRVLDKHLASDTKRQGDLRRAYFTGDYDGVIKVIDAVDPMREKMKE